MGIPQRSRWPGFDSVGSSPRHANDTPHGRIRPIGNNGTESHGKAAPHARGPSFLNSVWALAPSFTRAFVPSWPRTGKPRVHDRSPTASLNGSLPRPDADLVVRGLVGHHSASPLGKRDP